MLSKKHSEIAATLAKIIADMQRLPPEEQQKLLETLATLRLVYARTHHKSAEEHPDGHVGR